jgi:hypothetical protein
MFETIFVAMALTFGGLIVVIVVVFGIRRFIEKRKK